MTRFSMRPKQWLSEWRQWRADANALLLAMERFSMLHPHWHGAFFDEYFVQRVPRAALERRDGAELAREWARQFRYTDERQRMIDIRQVTPVAECFLRLLTSARRELPPGNVSTRVNERPKQAAAKPIRSGARRSQGPFGQESGSNESAKAEAYRRRE